MYAYAYIYTDKSQLYRLISLVILFTRMYLQSKQITIWQIHDASPCECMQSFVVFKISEFKVMRVLANSF